MGNQQIKTLILKSQQISSTYDQWSRLMQEPQFSSHPSLFSKKNQNHPSLEKKMYLCSLVSTVGGSLHYQFSHMLRGHL